MGIAGLDDSLVFPEFCASLLESCKMLVSWGNFPHSGIYRENEFHGIGNPFEQNLLCIFCTEGL